MENTEEKDISEEIPDSPIQIIITNDDAGQADESQASDEVTDENDKKDDKELDVVPKDMNEESTADTSGGLKVPSLAERRKSSLKVMDKKYSWLSALEEKYMNLETDFISKIQYVAISKHCQKYLEKLDVEESMIPYRVEFSNLFDKFRTTFVGSQRLLNKVSEIKSQKIITDGENRKIKITLYEKEKIIEELAESINNLQNDLLKMEKEKKNLQAMFNELQSDNMDNSYKTDQVLNKIYILFS